MREPSLRSKAQKHAGTVDADPSTRKKPTTLYDSAIPRTLDAPWTHLGRTLDAPWTHLGRTLDAPWTHLGRTLDAPWTHLGRTSICMGWVHRQLAGNHTKHNGCKRKGDSCPLSCGYPVAPAFNAQDGGTRDNEQIDGAVDECSWQTFKGLNEENGCV